MSEWQQKRFWKQAAAVFDESGFAVELDGRRLKTPAKTALVLPSHTLAEMVAAEWDAQTEFINPNNMPATRTANAAIDKVAPQHHEVASLLCEYGGTDLLCYRADSPAALADRQAHAWDPALRWAEDVYDAQLHIGTGVIHVPQNANALERLSAPVHQMSAFQLAAFHDLVSLSGSLVLGLAVTREWKSPDDLWNLSRVDELWQREQWGADEEADAQAEVKRQAFLHAAKFYKNS